MNTKSYASQNKQEDGLAPGVGGLSALNKGLD